jgi:hypothetical protein
MHDRYSLYVGCMHGARAVAYYTAAFGQPILHYMHHRLCTMHTCMQTCRTAKSFSFVSVIVFDLGAGISTAGKLITDGHVLNCSQA